MTFGEVCRKLRAAGYTNLWSLELWDRQRPPVTMTNDYIADNETRSKIRGEWDISDESVVVFVRLDGARFRVYRAA